MGNGARLRFPFLIIFLALVLLAGRLFCIQVLQGLTYFELAEKQSLKKVKSEGYRGEIFDRDGNLLATTIESQSLFLDPQEFDRSKETVHLLSSSLEINPNEIASKAGNGGRFVWLERKLSPTVVKQVADKKIKGVGVTEEQDRYYPNGALACHLIGAVGLDNHGLAGIEQSFDSFLTGKCVVTRQLRDGKGRKILGNSGSDLRSDPSANTPSAKSLTLTIDRSLQYLAEKEIQRGVEENQAELGMVVLQNPKTGEILAMASYPSFDPNQFSKGKVPAEIQGHSVQNPVVNKMFEPGSTFKVVTFSASLEEKKCSLSETINCESGKWKFKDTTINDHEGHAELTVPQVLEKSSNIGTAKMGLRLGKESLYRYARAFGFGTKTGVTLPGETAGLLRSPQSWSPISLPIISFGQEIGVTAIQMIGAFSTIANGGTLMEPQVIRQESHWENGKMVATHFSPQVVRRVVSEETAETVQKLLLGVTERGTGIQAVVPGYTVAGKTGTAQKIDPRTKKYYKDRYLASFCGFLPAENPKVVCLVILDEPKRDYWGGSTSGPIFSRIMSRAVKILGIPPDVSRPILTQKKDASLAPSIRPISSLMKDQSTLIALNQR